VEVGASLTPWLALLALALGPTLGGYALFTISLRHIPGRIASLIVVIEAPIATLAAVLFLGERIEPIQAVGMLFVLLAAVLPGLPLQLARREPAAG
jgi:drug/metabolite transporter (DMT)-like permease